ncbi:DUF6602 domain-containing protein [uncultured Flavobacterium sp.]|uniref:DUF6602 domain-containing protein n=1 Tax=uncultured Flavobacterium sp. TaxID=165435 RepID=UPI0011F94D78|nr:DUF6602 domain-containing protein [uncultured Flavobacterium sp.]THD31264.1 MAG: hypothetical protein DI588_12815 [Flavobacterium johnsoniae]
MAEWNLSTLLRSLHDDIHQKLETARKSIGHSVSKGDASEGVWLELFNEYLPQRYKAIKGFIVDSKGNFSEQIDVIIIDRQYSPFIFTFKDLLVVPSESVYAVFEAKQSLTAETIQYANDKIASVRALERTSLPIPHAGGTYAAKAPHHITGGILTFECDWKPAFGKSLNSALDKAPNIDMGCVAAQGYFYQNDLDKTIYELVPDGKPATAFLFKLISDLQFKGTVPMIDVLAYSSWIID